MPYVLHQSSEIVEVCLLVFLKQYQYWDYEAYLPVLAPIPVTPPALIPLITNNSTDASTNTLLFQPWSWGSVQARSHFAATSHDPDLCGSRLLIMNACHLFFLSLSLSPDFGHSQVIHSSLWGCADRLNNTEFQRCCASLGLGLDTANATVCVCVTTSGLRLHSL